MSMTPAMESIFANAQQNAASLIEAATLAINAKVNTIEEAENMIQELSSEAVKFNELLTTIMNAMRQVESGDMQKEEAAGIIAPAVKELKDKCTALKISNAEAPGDDITEDEIAILRELIIGAKAAAEDRLVAIRLGDDDKVDPEVEAEVNTPEEAEEGFISNFIERRHEAKINKAKIEALWDSFKDKNAESILSQFAKAAMPLFEGNDKSHVKEMVAEMIRADQRSNANYTGKLSAKDYIVKSYNGITMAIMPGNLDGLGCNHILAPASDTDGDCFFFKKEICNIIMNPVKKEEVAPAQEAYNVEVAEEAIFLAGKYTHTNDAKTAKALYSNAKKLYSLGSKDKALQYMKHAKKLYEKTLASLLKSGKFENVERTESWRKSGTMIGIRRNVTKTDSMTFAIARSSLELKIDRCTAHILQWTTEAGKETYQQILDQLKAEREEAKAAKKAAKATENYESEGTNMEFNYDEFMFACESMMDELQIELDTDFALEADGVDTDSGETPSGLAAKLRSAMAKFKSAFKRGDKKAAEEAKAEVDAAADAMAEAEDGADEKKKSGLNKAVKIGLISAGTVAAVAGLTAAGIAISQKAKGEKVDIKGGARAIKKTVATSMHRFSENQKNRAASIRVGREEKKAQRQYEDQQRANQYMLDQAEKHEAAQKKRAAKKAAKKANEAFGISEFDVYEVILEALFEDDGYDSDMDLASAIESMI